MKRYEWKNWNRRPVLGEDYMRNHFLFGGTRHMRNKVLHRFVPFLIAVAVAFVSTVIELASDRNSVWLNWRIQ